MRRTTRVTAVLALAAVGACSRGGRAVEDGEPATQEAKVGEAQDERESHEAQRNDKRNDNAPGGPRNVRDVTSGTTQAGALTPVNNSGVSGNVSLLPAGSGQTEINISVNAPAGAAGGYKVSLNQGSCSTLGKPVAELTQVQVGAATVGSVSDTIPMAPEQIMNGEHSIAVYSNRAVPVACATLPRNAPTPGSTGAPQPPNGT